MTQKLLQHASVIDGSGKPAFDADVRVRDGWIEAIQPLLAPQPGEEIVDLTGLTLAPGFIDIHTHADLALLAQPAHLPKVMQGVTTEVFTNCGLGFAPVTAEALGVQRRYLGGLFGMGADAEPGVDWGWRTTADLLKQYERRGIGANAAYLAPHGAIRVSAMGMAERPATGEELKGMQAAVEEALADGAWGISTGLWYAPMRAADCKELVTLFRAAGFFATHQRDYGERLFEATEESIRIAEEAGVPVQISHLQMNGETNRGRAGEILAVLDRARARGVDVTCDTYPYVAGSTLIQSLLPAWAVERGPEHLLELLADPDAAQRIAGSLTSIQDWDRYRLAGAASASNAALDGLSFAEAATRRGMSVPDWVCAVLREEELRACYIHQAAFEENVQSILQWPGQMVGSDGLHLKGKTHPRLYGTFPRVLARYVRELRVLTAEEAVRKMTSAPADRLGLRKRGRVQAGFAADLVALDLRAVCDTASFGDPLQHPSGIPHVWVNGVPVKVSGRPTGALPGMVLRR